MIINIIFDRTLELGIVEEKHIQLDSLEINLVNLIYDYVGDNAYVSFCHYYENADMMNYGHCFPYIIRNGKYKWVVPYDDVTVAEFADTHHLVNGDTVTVYVDINCFGGGDPFQIASVWEWILFFSPLVIDGMIKIGGLFAFGDYAFKTIKSLSDSISRTPVPSDVAEAINKRKNWSLKKLGHLLEIDDEKLVEDILICCGFHKKDGIYRRNLFKYRSLRAAEFDYISECWGVSEYDENDPLRDIKQYIQGVNVLLTDIRIHSHLVNSDSFDIAIHKVSGLIENYKLIKRGKYFKFIELNYRRTSYDEYEIEELSNELDKLQAYLEDLIDYLHSKDTFVQ